MLHQQTYQHFAKFAKFLGTLSCPFPARGIQSSFHAIVLCQTPCCCSQSVKFKNATKKVPNEFPSSNLLFEMFIKIGLLPKESPIMTRHGPIKFEHDMGGPLPQFASLEEIPTTGTN